MKINNLIKNSSILSSPGLISILLSLISIPIHLEIAGVENYGNYIIFHFILVIASILNFGIGKSVTVSINNYPNKNKEIAYQGIKYSINIVLCLSIILSIIFFFRENFSTSNLISDSHLKYLFFGIVITVLYSTLEGIFQGNQKFKLLSFYNFLFFSLSLSLPSISLAFNSNLSLENLIIFSLVIKFFSIFFMSFLIIQKKMISKSNNKILFTNLKTNSKWLTLNNLLIHFYDLFDKYLVKIFLGPIAISIYSIPQQLTGKLSIISKGFSAFLLPNLSRKNNNNDNFNYSLKIFLKIIPVIIFLIFPLYEYFLKFWLDENFSQKILLLTKIFSLCAIFSCASHLLITKFEATKTLHKNLKIEFILMPFFLLALFFLTSNSYSLIQISFLILSKEILLLIFRLNLLKKDIKNISNYYIYSIIFIIGLYLSINFENFFYIYQILIIISFFIKND